MGEEINNTIIPCPECGAPGSFTCTSCKHEIKFNLQWSKPKEKKANKAEELKMKELEKDSVSTAEINAIEELINEFPLNMPAEIKEETKKTEIKNNDLQEEELRIKENRKSEEETARQKQALIDEIKASLQEDIKKSITEAIVIIRQDILNKLKPENKPEAKTSEPKKENSHKKPEEPAVVKEEPKKKVPEKEPAGPDKVDNKKRPIKKETVKISGKNKKEETRKPEGITEELKKEVIEERPLNSDEGDSWNKRIDVI